MAAQLARLSSRQATAFSLAMLCVVALQSAFLFSVVALADAHANQATQSSGDEPSSFLADSCHPESLLDD